MYNQINENTEKKNTSASNCENNNNKNFLLNAKESEEDKKYQDPKNTINGTSVNNTNGNKIIFNYEQNDVSNSNKNYIDFERKDKIFKVIYRNIHDAEAKDNIKQSIITNFINFFITFINFVISKKLNTNDKIFHIHFQTKNKIKVNDIAKLTVKKLLLFESDVNDKNKKNNNKKKNTESEYNLNQFNKIKNIISPSLDKLFETPVIDLFVDIYAKTDFKNQNEKEIDLTIYGVEGIIFKIDENIPTYEKLRDNNKDNNRKINIMDDIKNEIINLKRKKFKVEKKK